MFFVKNRRTGLINDFDSPDKVALFMLGKQALCFEIYYSGEQIYFSGYDRFTYRGIESTLTKVEADSKKPSS